MKKNKKPCLTTAPVVVNCIKKKRHAHPNAKLKAMLKAYADGWSYAVFHGKTTRYFVTKADSIDFVKQESRGVLAVAKQYDIRKIEEEIVLQVFGEIPVKKSSHVQKTVLDLNPIYFSYLAKAIGDKV